MAAVNLVNLNLQTLADLDGGKVQRQLMHHLSRAVYDCEQRPGDAAKRKVIFEIVLSPVKDPDSHELDSLKVEMECKSKVPTHRSKVFSMKAANGKLLFNSDFPDSLRQTALPETDEE